MFALVLKTVLLAPLGWVVAELVYRICLHPLAHIPGPKLAAATWWYDFYYDVVGKGRYTFKIQELHRQYGPVIRITPDEVHVHDVGFTDTIYAPASSPRNKYTYLTERLGLPKSVGPCTEHETHKIRRGALAPFFSKRNITYLQPILRGKVQQMCEKIAQHAGTGQPINLSDVFFAFSNDIVNNFLFAHEVNVLADENNGTLVRRNSTRMLLGVHVRRHFPWLQKLLRQLPRSIGKYFMPAAVKDAVALQKRIHAEVETVMQKHAAGASDQEAVGPTGKESVFDSLLSNPSLPTEEKELVRLEQEGILLTLAGTESPARALGVLIVHLLRNTHMRERLQGELADIPQDAPWTQLDQLPYLSALLEEAIRLSFGVTSRSARIARVPLVYKPTPHAVGPIAPDKSYIIPAHTPVSVSALGANTAETVFPDPFKFDPERWLGDEGRERRKFQFAFSKGSRKCLGTDLARAEIMLATVALMSRFDLELFETDESDVGFVHDFQVAMPRMESEGIRATVKLREA